MPQRTVFPKRRAIDAPVSTEIARRNPRSRSRAVRWASGAVFSPPADALTGSTPDKIFRRFFTRVVKGGNPNTGWGTLLDPNHLIRYLEFAEDGSLAVDVEDVRHELELIPQNHQAVGWVVVAYDGWQEGLGCGLHRPDVSLAAELAEYSFQIIVRRAWTAGEGAWRSR